MDSIHSKNKKPIKFVKRQVPEHPYCTNWPMSEGEKEEKMTRKVLKEVMFEEENEIEICVSCGAETSYKKGDDVTFRYGYIDGAGQLCFTCSQTRKMHKTGNYGDSEWTRYG